MHRAPKRLPPLNLQPRTERFRLAASTPFALALAFALGCGGGMPRPDLPAEEASLLELLPRDAFLGVRLDMRELRRVPHWSLIEEALRTDGEEALRYARETHRIVAVVGGMVEAPSYPEPDPESEQYIAPPEWVPLARALAGKLPKAAVLVEGAMAELCDRALEGHERIQRRGYSVGIHDGLAFVSQPGRCLLTFQPLLDTLFEEAGQPDPDLLGMLARVDDEGRRPILSVSTDYESPAYEEWVQAEAEAARAALERGEAPEPEVDPSDPNAAMMAALNASMQRMERIVQQTTLLFVRVSRIATRGMLASETRITHDARGYEVRMRTAFSDEDRGTMYRELTEMYLEIAAAAIETYELPERAREVLTAGVRAIRVEEHRDGYEVRARASDARVSSLIDWAREATGELGGSGAPAAVESMPPSVAIYDIEGMVVSVPPDEAIATAEQNAELILGYNADPDTRANIVAAWSRAYRTAGRYEDAIRVVRQVIDDEAQEVAQEPNMQWRFTSSGCLLTLSECEAHLTWGFATEARAAADRRVGAAVCTDEVPALDVCRARAVALEGRAASQQMLTERESDPYSSDAYPGVSRMVLLAGAGDVAAAYHAGRRHHDAAARGGDGHAGVLGRPGRGSRGSTRGRGDRAADGADS